MTQGDAKKYTVGHVEEVDFPRLGIMRAPAKVDSGADMSAIWASNVHEEPDGLYCRLFGEGSDFYTGEEIHFLPQTYRRIRIVNSFGHYESRYYVKLGVRVRGRLVNATFTLANRSNKTYPILLGRRLLTGKFVVDVSQGRQLAAREKAKHALRKKEINRMENEQL